MLAQDDDRTGLFRGGAALSLDKMTGNNYGAFSGNGNFDLFLSDKVSFRSDLYLHLGNLKNESDINLSKNHQLLVGVNYHLLSGKAIDPYVGGQVGVTSTQINDDHLIKPLIVPGFLVEGNPSFNPTSQLNFGFNYLASNYFHFFMDASYNMQITAPLLFQL